MKDMEETKFITAKENVKKKSLILKIGGIFFISLLFAIGILTGISVYAVKSTSQSAVYSSVINQLDGDLAIIETYLEAVYGNLSIKDSTLKGTKEAVDPKVIDMLSKQLGVEITIFVHENKEFKRILTTILDENGKRALGTKLDHSEAYDAISQNKDYSGNALILNKAFITKYKPIVREGKIQLVVFCGAEITEVNNEISSKLQYAVIYTLVGSGAILVMVIFITISLLQGLIVKPILKVVSVFKQVGEGDLTVSLPLIGNDEITAMSAHFNRTIGKMSSALRSVHNSAETMVQTGSELAGNMTETASAIHQISANIDGVKNQTISQSASVTESVSTVEQIIHTIKQLNESIESQAASVSESSASIEEMAANISSITKTLAKTDEAIKELAEATADGKETIIQSNSLSQKIIEESGSLFEASSVIQHIASQTNLLAMNAAIEAAHAGEAGKGFAVVADEIRKLSEESSSQGKAITSTLKNLSSEIEMLSTSSKTVEEKFNIIFTLAENVKEMSNTITAAMLEQENGSKEILAAIRDINSVTEKVKDGSAEMILGGEGIAKEMKQLEDMTRMINDSITEMASGTDQISKAVEEVNDITQKNKQNIEILAVEVNKFKI
ncbi:methyl-accepting chemotaxis protein [Treponema putidum]|uniref:methyl-accepting chemotaxis protein n=1 Tax=Treponema putidum TaxID=221027 RepID=UPI003D8F3D1D